MLKYCSHSAFGTLQSTLPSTPDTRPLTLRLMQTDREAEHPLPVEPSGPSWAALEDADLLKWRLRDLKVSIEGSALQSRVQRLYDELATQGLAYRPPCYLATEWLCPDRIPAIGIPFYLAHPRLIRLERTMMLEAEGDTEKECMKLLRHETGHAINYAYRLYRRSRWRELFGPISKSYNPHHYRRRPYSRQYVVHLQYQYAQAHPDEDFAETFAVWLTPDSNWKQRYRGRGALRKLEYVDHLMREMGDTPPPVKAEPRHFHWSVARSRATLETYFKTKRREFARAYIGYYDAILKDLFPDPPGPDTEKAHRFLSRHRKKIRSEVTRWARIPKYAADDLIRRLSQRAREMDLHLPPESNDAAMRIGICITALALEAREQYLRELNEEKTP